MIRKALGVYPRDSIVRHGKAPGADRMADNVARALGMTTDPMPANWDAHGKSAGPRRNIAMLEKDPKPDVVLAFLLPGCVGTIHCVKEAVRRGLKVRRFVRSGELPDYDPYAAL